MSFHKGITCDVCLKESFAGIRYKCLACHNYDLCSICYNGRRYSMQHLNDHPVQTILTQSEFEVFFGCEAKKSDRQYQSFTCSYCGAMGFSNVQLREHILTEHSSSSNPVICPLCTVLDGGRSISLVDGLSAHMTNSHSELLESGSGTVRSGRQRTHHAQRHGVWMTMPLASRRDISGIPSEILSGRHRDDILSHLSGMRGGYAAEELLSLELQFPDGNRRTPGLSYEHLIGNDDLRLFYDPLLVPVASNEQSNSTATGSLPSSSAERTKNDQPVSRPTFLLEELVQKKNEEEKETWEMENVDRSVFVQELFLSTFFQPTNISEMDNGRCFSQQPVDINVPPTDLSLVTAPSLSMNCMQQPSIEMTQD